MSARGRRDMPLRVQAMRRSHQQAFAAAIEARIEEENQSWSRRPTLRDHIIPSDLWTRRRRTSPEQDERERLQIELFGDDGQILNDAERLFARHNAEGHLTPYSINSDSSTSSASERDPLEIGLAPDETPRRPPSRRDHNVQYFEDENGNLFI